MRVMILRSKSYDPWHKSESVVKIYTVNTFPIDATRAFIFYFFGTFYIIFPVSLPFCELNIKKIYIVNIIYRVNHKTFVTVYMLLSIRVCFY